MPDPIETAQRRFGEGFNCAQAVLSAFAEAQGLPAETALRVAAAFGGGIARTGETCGALTGALMALGLRFGATVGADQEAKERQYRLAQDLMARFTQRHGSTRCHDLLGCRILTAEDRQRAHDEGRFETICPQLVTDAAALVAEILK